MLKLVLWCTPCHASDVVQLALELSDVVQLALELSDVVQLALELSDVVQLALELAGRISVFCDRLRQRQRLQLLSQCGSTYNCPNRYASPPPPPPPPSDALLTLVGR